MSVCHVISGWMCSSKIWVPKFLPIFGKLSSAILVEFAWNIVVKKYICFIICGRMFSVCWIVLTWRGNLRYASGCNGKCTVGDCQQTQSAVKQVNCQNAFTCFCLAYWAKQALFLRSQWLMFGGCIWAVNICQAICDHLMSFTLWIFIFFAMLTYKFRVFCFSCDLCFKINTNYSLFTHCSFVQLILVAVWLRNLVHLSMSLACWCQSHCSSYVCMVMSMP